MYSTNNIDSILKWYDIHKRSLPWRATNDPYKIWLSETMLQQTQVNIVIPYYKKWINKYPTVQSVANANLDSLLKLWEGMGYYSRCRNFYNAANIIINHHNGKIPDDKKTFQLLPGVGEYISGAVLSIAFNKQYPAMDGNQKRVISRLLGLKKLSKHNELRIKKKLKLLVNCNRPGDINQALMDIGSSICKPKNVFCDSCPLQQSCKAFLSEMPLSYPEIVKQKPISIKKMVAALISYRRKVLIIKRPEKGFLGGLWELPMVEISNNDSESSISKYVKKYYGLNIIVEQNLGEVNHAYTHFKVKIVLFKCNCEYFNKSIISGQWIRMFEIKQYAFSKANHKLFNLLTVNNV